MYRLSFVIALSRRSPFSMNKAIPPAAEATAHPQEALVVALNRLVDSVKPERASTLLTALKALVATRSHLTTHFGAEEEEDWTAALREQEPRLGHAIERLVAEHRELAHCLDALIDEAEAARDLNGPLRDKILRWVERVREHEAREVDLLEEAFDEDIGAGD
jgi:hypothetical protein